MEIPPTSYLDGVDFIVRTGGELRISRAHLKKCLIMLETGASLTLDSCALEKCEFNSNVPSVSESRSPSCRMTNCVIRGGAWLVEANRLGLEMIDCVVRDQTITSYQLMTSLHKQVPLRLIASRPVIRYTKLENCRLNHTVFLMTTQCSFDKCESFTRLGKPSMKAWGQPQRLVRMMPRRPPQERRPTKPLPCTGQTVFLSDVDMQISFEEKYSDKDGPSAAVACALLMEACIAGNEWDPTWRFKC